MLEIEAISVWLGQHSSWLLPAIALIAFTESFAIAGIIVPGVAILFSAAALASLSQIPLIQVLIAAFIGAVAGDVLSFFLGRWFKDHLQDSWVFRKYPGALKQGEKFFNKYGTVSVVIGRFVGPLRPVLPLTAGMLGMSAYKFVFINILSAMAWAPFYILPGYIGGELTQLDAIQNDLGNIAWLVLLFCGALLPWLMLFRNNREKRLPIFWNASLATGLFAGLCLVLKMGYLESLDVWAFSHAISWRSSFLDPILVAVTMFGDEWLLTALFVLIVVQLVIVRRLDWAITFALTGVLTSILTRALKTNFDLARPDYIAGQITSAAFPSGHTSGSWVLLGLLALLWVRERQHSIAYCLGATFTLAASIAASRLLLGVHWVSDIAGGILIAALLVAVGAWTQHNVRRALQHHDVGKHLIVQGLDTGFWHRTVLSLFVAFAAYQWFFFERLLPLYHATF